jgi:pyridoxal phosphate enzyme (YggS family)
VTAPDRAIPERAIPERVAAVRDLIARAAARAGRDPAEVTLVAATKTVAVERIRAVVAAGVTDVGENRAQELVAKAPAVDGATWHFVGALQRNKVRALAPWVRCYETVDREPLGVEIARHAPGARVFVEVNLAGEPQKAGCMPDDAGALADRLRDLGLDVRGLMTVPPAGEDARPWFASLRELAGRCGLPELSMGMSADFEAAVEEGATTVRVGRALFGERGGAPAGTAERNRGIG